MSQRFIVPAGVPAIRYHAGLNGPESCTTTKVNTFVEDELIARPDVPESYGIWPDRSYAKGLAEEGHFIFKRMVFKRVWLLAVKPEHIEGL